MKKVLFVISLIVVLFAPVMSEALPVPIQNYSFESNSGWTVSGQGGQIYIPPSWFFSEPVPDGTRLAWANTGQLSQMLSYTLLPDTELTLSVDIGRRSDIANYRGYEIQLWAYDQGTNSGTLLASDSSLIPDRGYFETAMVSYIVDNSYVGDNVIITLVSRGTQTSFDNVRLNNDPIRSVPEPSTLLLLGSGLLGFGIFARKRKK